MSSAKKMTMTILAMVMTLTAVTATAMVGIPESSSLEFTVLRDGAEVGTHFIRFEERGGQVSVDVQTLVDVKLPFIGVSVYHFKHSGREVWRDGVLQTLESSTDDDGEAKALKVRRVGDLLEVEGSKGQHESAGTLIPASLWHPELVHNAVLLNTLDGREMQVQVSEQGTEPVEVRGRSVSARHFVVSGGLNRELWYDARGVLVKVAFPAKDDSRIEYVLK